MWLTKDKFILISKCSIFQQKLISLNNYASIYVKKCKPTVAIIFDVQPSLSKIECLIIFFSIDKSQLELVIRVRSTSISKYSV